MEIVGYLNAKGCVKENCLCVDNYPDIYQYKVVSFSPRNSNGTLLLKVVGPNK